MKPVSFSTVGYRPSLICLTLLLVSTTVESFHHSRNERSFSPAHHSQISGIEATHGSAMLGRSNEISFRHKRSTETDSRLAKALNILNRQGRGLNFLRIASTRSPDNFVAQRGKRLRDNWNPEWANENYGTNDVFWPARGKKQEFNSNGDEFEEDPQEDRQERGGFSFLRRENDPFWAARGKKGSISYSHGSDATFWPARGRRIADLNDLLGDLRREDALRQNEESREELPQRRKREIHSARRVVLIM